MSIESKWEELTVTVTNEEDNILRDLVFKFNNVKDNLTEEGIKEAEKEYIKVCKYLKSLEPKEYDAMDKLIKVQLIEMKDKLNKLNNNKKTRWEMFREEAINNDWKPILKVIEEIQEIDNTKKMSEEIYEKIENYMISLSFYIDKNLSPYDADWTYKEFAKKLRIFRNRLENSMKDDFGSWLKQLRKSKGYSLKDLERVTGVTASYIHRIEDGSRKTVSVQYIEKLALGLGVSSADLLNKMNLSDSRTENKEVLTGLAEMIILKPFTINGKKADKEQKQLLVDIYKKIITCKWTEDSKLSDTMDIANIIGEFKKTI